MRKVILLLMIFSLALVTAAQDDGPPPMPEIDGDIIVEGLNGPQGLFVDSEGTLWIAENGTGGDEEITFFNVNTYEEEPGFVGESARLIRVAPDGNQETVVTLPSVTAGADRLGAARIAELDGTIYVSYGIWAQFMGDEVTVPYFGTIIKLGEDDEVMEVADIWAYENEENPDGIDLRETHPYGIAFGPDNMLYVADAAGNSLLSVDVESGEVSTVTAFEPLPGVFPNPVMDNQMLAQAVPTSVVFDDEGTLYVSYLSGAPFVPGTAKVVTVGEDGTVEDFAPGLTMLTDLEYGPDGNFYATQFAIFGQTGPQPNSGAVIRILPDGTSEMVIGGLPNVTAITFDENGNGYVAINGANPPQAPDGLGMVVYYEDLVSRDGMPMPEMDPPADEGEGNGDSEGDEG